MAIIESVLLLWYSTSRYLTLVVGKLEGKGYLFTPSATGRPSVSVCKRLRVQLGYSLSHSESEWDSDFVVIFGFSSSLFES